MSESVEILQRKIANAGTLGSVVRTMKTLAAINIRQYEEAVRALEDYYHNVELGLAECLRRGNGWRSVMRNHTEKEVLTIIVAFGSDQGLVGQFNEQLAETVRLKLETISGSNAVLSVGERIQLRLEEIGIRSGALFAVPNSVNAITPMIGDLLSAVEQLREHASAIELHLFFNSPVSGAIYRSESNRLLPLDEAWVKDTISRIGAWPTKAIPEILNSIDAVEWALVREYLFVSLFRACAESLASENASRLSAMQRAEKNIDEMIEELTKLYNERRQAGIDEELFDVVSGFQALNNKK
jgi:F-type H+-transporting ATPase subunit gamma